MRRVSFWQDCPSGSVFAPITFDDAIGRQFGLTVRGQQRGQGTLVAAAVAPDGRRAWLTVELPDDIDFAEVMP